MGPAAGARQEQEGTRGREVGTDEPQEAAPEDRQPGRGWSGGM